MAVLASLVGLLFIKLGKKQNIMMALYKGLIASGVLAAVGFYPIIEKYFNDGDVKNIFFASLIGLVVTGLLIFITEFYTSTA